jgi:hypothetical protein
LKTDLTLGTGGNTETAITVRVDAQPVGNRRLVAFAELMSREAGTVKYEYNPATKAVEPIKERVALGQSMLELPGEVKKPRTYTGAAAR